MERCSAVVVMQLVRNCVENGTIGVRMWLVKGCD